MILSKCSEKIFKPLSYLQPQTPSLAPNSISFIAKWPFPTHTISQSLICSKANQPTNSVHSSVSFGCLQTRRVITPKAKDSGKEGPRWARKQKGNRASHMVKPQFAVESGKEKARGALVLSQAREGSERCRSALKRLYPEGEGVSEPLKWQKRKTPD